jgi:hypothetical protein
MQYSLAHILSAQPAQQADQGLVNAVQLGTYFVGAPLTRPCPTIHGALPEAYPIVLRALHGQGPLWRAANDTGRELLGTVVIWCTWPGVLTLLLARR